MKNLSQDSDWSKREVTYIGSDGKKHTAKITDFKIENPRPAMEIKEDGLNWSARAVFDLKLIKQPFHIGVDMASGSDTQIESISMRNNGENTSEVMDF